MQTNIVRQPIISAEKKVFGYEVLYQEKGGEGLYNQADTDAAIAIESFITDLSNEPLMDDKIAFITFTPNLLLRYIPRFIPAEKLVIEVEDHTIVHPVAQKIIYTLRKEGYKVALKNFQFSTRYFSLLDVADYIKIDMTNVTETDRNIAKIGESFKIDTIAYNVNSKETYALAKELNCKYMQGTMVAEAMFSQVKKVEHSQSNFFQLMVAATKEEPDIDELSKIIERDVTLSFTLLKLVNSAYFSLKNRVSTIKQALMVLGLGQFKQWVYLLSFKNSDGEVSYELIKTSFLRANFCSELSCFVTETHIEKNEAYLLGMFSTLEALLGVPLKEALSELPIIDEIKDALIREEGPMAPLYNLIISYEKADWKSVKKYTLELGIPENIVSQKYFECIEFVNNIWSGIIGNGEDNN